MSTEEKQPYEDMEKYSSPFLTVNMLGFNDKGKTSEETDAQTLSIQSDVMRDRAISAPVIKPKPRGIAVSGKGPFPQRECDNQNRCKSFSVTPRFSSAVPLRNKPNRNYVNCSNVEQVKNKLQLVIDKEKRKTRSPSVESEYVYPSCDFIQS